MFAYLRKRIDLMSKGEIEFIRSLERYFKKQKHLSEAQAKILQDIRKYIK